MYINKKLHTSNHFARLRAVPRLSTFFYTPCIILFLDRSKTKYYCTLSKAPSTADSLLKFPPTLYIFLKSKQNVFKPVCFIKPGRNFYVDLLSEKDNKSTKKATTHFKSIFEEYLHEIDV